MRNRYLLSIMFLASISILSCRQDDEIASEELVNKKVFSTEETSKKADSSAHVMLMSDSIILEITPTDPPKNGTHWKLTDSIQVTTNP